jgi:hypothetical protein
MYFCEKIYENKYKQLKKLKIMGLFTPAWKSKNEEKAIRSVKKMTDQKKLVQIIRESGNWRLRKAAVENLSDQTLLASVAIHDPEEYVRKAAVEKITDQTQLAHIAINDKDRNVRETAVKNEYFVDQKALARIVKSESNFNVRNAAVEKLFDPNELKNVVKYFSNIDISNVKDNASILIVIAQKFPKVMKKNWKQIDDRIKTLHKDGHDDFSPNCYTDHSDITAASLGVVFPPYPFKD